MSDRPFLPPRPVVRGAWRVHRAVRRGSRGRAGLWRPRARRWGTLELTTTGRRSGQQRRVLVGYYDDGPAVVTLAMNGWSAPEPAWWLNLQADPAAWVDVGDGPRRVRAREAEGEERERLWDRWRHYDGRLDDYAALRGRRTAVVVLEPHGASGGPLTLGADRARP